MATGVPLAKIGAAVHFLDVGGIPVADANGLETVLTGIKEKARSDDALAAMATSAALSRILFICCSSLGVTKVTRNYTLANQNVDQRTPTTGGAWRLAETAAR